MHNVAHQADAHYTTLRPHSLWATLCINRKMTGFVYFLSNPSMPGMVKVGSTSGSVEARMSQLNGTGVPMPFQLIAQFAVSKSRKTEFAIHEALKDRRVSGQREFFSGTEKEILEIAIPALLDGLSISNSRPTYVDNVLSDKYVVSERGNLLLLEMTWPRSKGFSLYDFERMEEKRINPLIIERELEELRQKGLVDYRKARGGNDWDIWRISSLGIKYLFDAGLLSEETLPDAPFY